MSLFLRRPLAQGIGAVAVICLQLLMSEGLTAQAQEQAEIKPRPKVGLVLEGGGALGFAHVGVLKVLEEQRVPIDYIAGTSIGSIVGAAYASGLSVAEMEKALSETDWGDLFGERVQRGDLTYRLKAGRGRELYGDTKFGIKDGKMVTPAGLIVGQNILPLFQKLFGNLPSPTDFDLLPVPFRAITADLETGAAYIPKSGNLAAVVRASMSVPGAFSPVELDGKVLVDGGIVNNLPVNVARDLGADVLVVSALDDELAKRDDLKSLLAVSGQMISLLLEQNSAISRKTVKPEDILVAIDLKGYTAGDFEKSQTIMGIGEAAARNYIERFKEYAVTEEEYKRYQEKRTRKTPAPVKIDFVRVVNSSDISDERIKRQLKVKAGDVFDVNIVDKDIERIFGSGYFTSVRYDLVQEDGKTGLEIKATGKDWLSQFVRLGLALEDNFEGDSAFRLGAAYRHYHLTTRGSYAEGQFEVGKIPRIGLEFYQPLGEDSPYFISPQLTYGRTNIGVLQNGEPIAQYNRTEGQTSLTFGRELGSYGETGIGVTRGFGELERDIGDPALNYFDYDIGEAFARIDIDTLDTPDFPTSGFTVTTRYTSSLEDLGAENDFDTLQGATTLPFTFGRNTILFSGDFAATFSERPIERSFGLGGFLDVSGYQPGTISASDYAKGRILYFHRFSEVHNPLFNLGFFFGGSFELTSAWVDSPQLQDTTDIVSGALFLGADTPLLPTYVGYGMNDEQETSFYLAIGRIGQQRR